MIKAQINSIVNQLKNHSASLEKSNILTNKAWTIVDEDNEIQRLIFKNDKSLILSKNGQAVIGKWDYFPEAKSILIDRGNSDKILCNEAFLDNGVLILRLDGTDNKFFILANEDVIPDLDVFKYLKNVRHQKLDIAFRKLVNGKVLEIERVETRFGNGLYGQRVSIDDEDVPDGKYLAENNEMIYEIADSIFIRLINIKVYKTSNNIEITIHQNSSYLISKGDDVYIDNRLAESQTIDFTKGERLVIYDGKVVRVESKNAFLRSIYNFFGINMT